MAERPRYLIQPTAYFTRQMRDLNDRAVLNPGGEQDRLLRSVLERLQAIAQGRENGTHSLGLGARTADLRDCETTYVNPDLDDRKRPSHRLIWRQLPPARPGEQERRQIINLGPRQGAEAYDISGRVLEREPGERLVELDTSPRARQDMRRRRDERSRRGRLDPGRER